MDNLQNSGLVKLVARFFSEETLGKWVEKIIYMLNSNSFRQQAGKLFAWAIVIILFATIVDKAFYWTRPEQKLILKNNIEGVRSWIHARGKR
ncbi:MAG: hypothetical protein AB1Z23_10670 [Eubacteriales bacterium]